MKIQEATQQKHDNSFRHVGMSSMFVRAISVFLLLLLNIFVWNAATVYAGPDDHSAKIRVLSGPPDMVSGGDALMEVRVSGHVAAADLAITLNGKDIAADFQMQPDGAWVGLARGMTPGVNHLAVLMKEGNSRPAADLEIINHPIGGPVFSGPHQMPFICETTTFELPVTGVTLGPPLDADCSIATRIDYVYRSTDGKFKPLPNPATRPADLAQTTTDEGQTVNYIVRLETGTINRAIYQIAILHDPTTVSSPSPRLQLPGWNGRLLYRFGGGCTPGYHQGNATGGPLDDLWLSKGYAAAASSLNVFGNNCNDVISAETMMMVKEHFIKQYGVPRYTIGWGTSGGSMQQHLLALNYPGLLDGITPGRSFPDAITFFTPIADCKLLARAISGSTQPWTTEQKAAVAGWGTWDFCTEQISSDWGALTRAGLDPGVKFTGCSAAIPPALIYDPVKNSSGARCTYFDNAANIFGRDPKTGFAWRTIDNVGVQYGLQAFNARQISAKQFLELNERIGGYDIDGNMISNRMVADPEALRIAYETGRLDEGGGGLSSVPIIDYRAYRDLIADPHDSVRSHIMRARLIANNGTAANQVILVGPQDSTPAGAAIFASMSSDVLRLMDQWLGNIARDASPYNSLTEKVVRNKPAELVDGCYGAAGEKISDAATCKSLYPVHSNPRLAAGQPLANDVLKCQLKPANPRDYVQPMTADQEARLKAIFRQGVCDYSHAGVGQKRLEQTWLAYPHPGKFELTSETKHIKD